MYARPKWLAPPLLGVKTWETDARLGLSDYPQRTSSYPAGDGKAALGAADNLPVPIRRLLLAVVRGAFHCTQPCGDRDLAANTVLALIALRQGR